MITAPSVSEDITRTLAFLMQPGDVIEIRVLDTKRGTQSGYYDNLESATAAVRQLNGQATAVYVTLNPVHPDLLARAKNRLQQYAKHTTCDPDIVQRRWFLIDMDPRRPAGISSTELEHAAALYRADQCRDWLRQEGWRDPIYADSGNGAHLVYRIDLPNDPQSNELLKKCLQAVAIHFTDDSIEVDLTVHNASRITKAYGTQVRKGDNTEDRPHRTSCLMDVPSRLDVVPPELLHRLASLVPDISTGDGRRAKFDLQTWIADHDLPVVATAPWNGGGRKWILNPCPWNHEHQNRAAYIVQLANGAIAAGCRHNGCANKRWNDLRDIAEPGWQSRRSAQSMPPGTPTDSNVRRGHDSPLSHSLMEFDPSRTPPRQQSYFEGLLNDGDLAVYIAREKHRKSNIALQIGICAALGRDFLHFRFVAPGPLKVVILDYETRSANLWERYHAICRAMKLDSKQMAQLQTNLRIVEVRRAHITASTVPRFPVKVQRRKDDEFQIAENWWRNFVEDTDADLYILDPMRCLHVEAENDSNIEQLLARLRQVFRGKTTMVPHHLRKYTGKHWEQIPLKEDMRWWSDNCRGSGAIKAHADVVICQEREIDNDVEVLYFGAFSKDEADLEPLRLQESEPMSFYWEVSMSLPTHLKRAFDALSAEDERFEDRSRMRQVLEAAGLKRSTAYRQVGELVASGFLVATDGSWRIQRRPRFGETDLINAAPSV